MSIHHTDLFSAHTASDARRGFLVRGLTLGDHDLPREWRIKFKEGFLVGGLALREHGKRPVREAENLQSGDGDTASEEIPPGVLLHHLAILP
jgi:hypothetical protein